MTRGVVYVAYGDKARQEAAASLATLHHWSDVPAVVVSSHPFPDHSTIQFRCEDPGARWAKLHLDMLSPFDQTLYLDADTRVHGAFESGWQALDAGFDLVMALSSRQGSDVLGNCDGPDREMTFKLLGSDNVLGLQAGAFFFQRNYRTARLFGEWRYQWQHFKRMDQAALLRALRHSHVRMWLMATSWHGANGQVIEHLFGRAA